MQIAASRCEWSCGAWAERRPEGDKSTSPSSQGLADFLFCFQAGYFPGGVSTFVETNLLSP